MSCGLHDIGMAFLFLLQIFFRDMDGTEAFLAESAAQAWRHSAREALLKVPLVKEARLVGLLSDGPPPFECPPS